MAVPVGVQTLDIASALEQVLTGVEGLRTYRYVADNVRVPAAIIAMPSIDYADPDAGYCAATWDFPISLIVSRASDRSAQDALSRLVSEVATAINTAPVEGVFSVEVLTARPTSIDVSGQPLPAYNLHVRIRA